MKTALALTACVISASTFARLIVPEQPYSMALAVALMGAATLTLTKTEKP